MQILDFDLFGFTELKQEELLLIEGGNWTAGWFAGFLIAFLLVILL